MNYFAAFGLNCFYVLNILIGIEYFLIFLIL